MGVWVKTSNTELVNLSQFDTIRVVQKGDKYKLIAEKISQAMDDDPYEVMKTYDTEEEAKKDLTRIQSFLGEKGEGILIL